MYKLVRYCVFALIQLKLNEIVKFLSPMNFSHCDNHDSLCGLIPMLTFDSRLRKSNFLIATLIMDLKLCERKIRFIYIKKLLLEF